MSRSVSVASSFKPRATVTAAPATRRLFRDRTGESAGLLSFPQLGGGGGSSAPIPVVMPVAVAGPPAGPAATSGAPPPEASMAPSSGPSPMAPMGISPIAPAPSPFANVPSWVWIGLALAVVGAVVVMRRRR